MASKQSSGASGSEAGQNGESLAADPHMEETHQPEANATEARVGELEETVQVWVKERRAQKGKQFTATAAC